MSVRTLTTIFAVSTALGLGACQSNSPETPGTTTGTSLPPPDADGVFESAHPGGDQGAARAGTGTTGGAALGAESADASTATGSPATTVPPMSAANDTDVARDIEEADIVKFEGTRLYALSRVGGLSVIDVADPANMSLLGRFKVNAEPFEMYVRDGIAMVLYNGYGEYEYDEDEDVYSYYQTSYVMGIDTTSPESIAELGRYHVPGYISDSRIVGNVLYVVAHEYSGCWGCDQGPRTNLISVDVTEPSAMSLVDELSIEDRENEWSWERSVEATDERLFIAGPNWGGGNEPEGSTIQIVDISDPSGVMMAGATVAVNGQIQSRWQMNEHDGVLRVISQPFIWRSDDAPPRIETYAVASSAQLEPLASVAMVIPRNESLRSVRFDGARGYAITAEQMDPLFTIDLSDPTAPRQVGELEMPGWVYHMEPRGDRVLGLGYDQGNEDGAITVSLFDVSDLANPTMLRRVNFGGDWGSLPEDQNRIHKAFTILDDASLVLVPFSGWDYSEQNDVECSPGRYLSGVQMIDWDDDTLVLRGAAPVTGQARRGRLVSDRLLTMSDDRVESFDIANRDAPAALDRVSLALRADRATIHGNVVTRLGQDWYTGSNEITVTTLADANNPDKGVTIPLPQISETESCYSYSYLSDVLTSDDDVYLLYQRQEWDPNGSKSTQSFRAITIDATSAQIVGNAEIGSTVSDGYWWTYGIVDDAPATLNDGTTLILSRHEATYDNMGNTATVRRSIDIVDMSDPAAPSTVTVDMPSSQGTTGLRRSGDVVATSHFVQSPSTNGSVRFFLDRVDISDPASPQRLPAVNIPGSLIAYDAESEHALTVDYRTETEPATARVCNEQLYGGWNPPNNDYSNYDYERTVGTCFWVLHTLRLVAIEDGKARILDSYGFARGEGIGSTSLGDDRLFVALGGNYYYGAGVAIGAATIDIAPGFGGGRYYYYPFYSFAHSTAPLHVFGGIRGEELTLGTVELDTGDNYYGSFPYLLASGHNAVVSTGFQGKLAVVDASDAATPKVAREIDVSGWISSISMDNGVAIAAMGTDGIQTIRVDDPED